jgi:hypothetical protein
MGNIVEECKGCDRIDPSENCMVYANPAVQMRWVGKKSALGCSFNQSAYVKDEGAKTKTRVGQQKQKKK